MEKRVLGSSGLTVSALGLGCMGMSEFYGPTDDAQSLATLERALELGITFLDTADMYGSGHNEQLLGRFLRGRREKVVLATKFGIVREPGRYERTIDTSPAYVRAACDASLAWLLQQGKDIVPIPGTKRIKYLEENVASASLALSADDLARLDRALPRCAAAGDRYPPAGMKGLNA